MLRRVLTRRAVLPRTTFTSSPQRQTRPISFYKKISTLGPRLFSRYPLLQDTLRYCRYAAALALVSHIFFDYFYALHLTWGPSMLPTLESSGTSVLISKFYRRGRGIEVGDMVSFTHPIEPEFRAIKRVIGMPGDFVLRDTPGKGDGMMIQVPQGHVWLVGDNLPYSRDSRMYGPLPLALVRGKIVAVWRSWFELPELVHNALHDVQDDDD